MEYVSIALGTYFVLGLIIAIVQVIRKPLDKRIEELAKKNPLGAVQMSTYPHWWQSTILFFTIFFLWPVEIYLSFKGQN